MKKAANVASQIEQKAFLTSHATYFYVTEHVTHATIKRLFCLGGGDGRRVHRHTPIPGPQETQ